MPKKQQPSKAEPLLDYYYYSEKKEWEMAVRNLRLVEEKDLGEILNDACLSGKAPIVRYILNNHGDVKLYKNTFDECCFRGHYPIVEVLLEKRLDFVADYSDIDYIVDELCYTTDYVDIIELLDDYFEIYFDDKIETACFNKNSLTLAEFILPLYHPYHDLYCKHKYIFERATRTKNYSLLELLASLDPTRFVLFRKNGQIMRVGVSEYPIIQYVDIEVTSTMDECVVCYGHSEIFTSCHHHICKHCALQLQSNTCPYCRQQLTGYIKKIPSTTTFTTTISTITRMRENNEKGVEMKYNCSFSKTETTITAFDKYSKMTVEERLEDCWDNYFFSHVYELS